MTEDDILRKLAAKIEGSIFGALGMTSATNAAPKEPFTLDKLRRMMLDLPPKETWLSSRLFPNDKAWVVKGAGENFTCAGPGFWLRLEDFARKNAKDFPTPFFGADRPFEIAGNQPIEIDAWPDDSPETAKWRADHWRRLREAIEVAMVPLPDWLRNAPKFGEHG